MISYVLYFEYVLYIVHMEVMVIKRYIIELSDDLSDVYEDIAKMNKKDVEECLVIILEKVISTMLNLPYDRQR